MVFEMSNHHEIQILGKQDRGFPGRPDSPLKKLVFLLFVFGVMTSHSICQASDGVTEKGRSL
ncbi:MAG: hypothetical protein ACI87E_000951, partial [Mariniblastus sp.]